MQIFERRHTQDDISCAFHVDSYGSRYSVRGHQLSHGQRLHVEHVLAREGGRMFIAAADRKRLAEPLRAQIMSRRCREETGSEWISERRSFGCVQCDDNKGHVCITAQVLATQLPL